ncbi:hypothetical protein Ga0102493_112207 [Erythrobacter litoralis]|uniref:Uncharacterized protein n=1 Tax=Erythrobacter litoralis TaxID=39960 RepID=A0A074MIN3_9SPHN|nr:hypothetical protein [Erythrobacter litoralis]AOL23224.1 hypothetical protein Ga0102493_112207 [Erythrobacter litoralis]KEO92630.1 hypothetical protein EH32_15345 [Erythrobacter litoralis]
MAEIPVEKKSGGKGWLWLILLLLIVAAIAWWLLEEAAEGDLDDDEVAIERTEPVITDTDTDTAQMAGAGAMTIAAITADPSAFYGREGFSGTVTVGGPLTDRGFWIENGGARMFAIVIDQPRERPVDINVGATLDITGGTVRNPGEIEDLTGDALDQDTIDAMEGQQAVLVVSESDIDISDEA